MNRINPPNYFMVFIIIIILSHFIFPIKEIIFYPNNLIGILFIGLGIYLNLWVWNVFRKINTTIKTHDKPKKLVTYGAFKISRNPLYLGMILILLGESFLLGSLITFIFPILYILLLNNVTIPFEEDNMGKKFGKKYLDYKKMVRKWL